jgi:hypothetical protein
MTTAYQQVFGCLPLEVMLNLPAHDVFCCIPGKSQSFVHGNAASCSIALLVMARL